MIEMLRKLIREELGRDLKSPRPDPLSWRNYPKIQVLITAVPAADGGYYVAQVIVEDDEDNELSTQKQKFKTEKDAEFWAKDKADHAYKVLLMKPDYDPNEIEFK